MSATEATVLAGILTALTMILIAVAGWAWRLSGQLAQASARAAADLAALELRMAKEYASVDHLQDVERRLVGAIGELRDALDRTTGEIKSAVELMVKSFQEHMVDEARTRRAGDR